MNPNPKEIRWKQRFQNLQPAFTQLSKGLAIETPSDIEKQGIIQSFEFTFELSWKTLKDYMESQGILAGFPREVIKQAFHHQIILDGELWLEMMGKRNLGHTYDAKLAEEAYQLIANKYFKPLGVVLRVTEHIRITRFMKFSHLVGFCITEYGKLPKNLFLPILTQIIA